MKPEGHSTFRFVCVGLLQFVVWIGNGDPAVERGIGGVHVRVEENVADI